MKDPTKEVVNPEEYTNEWLNTVTYKLLLDFASLAELLFVMAVWFNKFTVGLGVAWILLACFGPRFPRMCDVMEGGPPMPVYAFIGANAFVIAKIVAMVSLYVPTVEHAPLLIAASQVLLLAGGALESVVESGYNQWLHPVGHFLPALGVALQTLLAYKWVMANGGF
jgi:hypothetical protein